MPDITQLMAQMGRGGDTMVGHLSPGEFVIPRPVLGSQPQLMTAILRAFNGYNKEAAEPLDWRGYVAGKREIVDRMIERLASGVDRDEARRLADEEIAELRAAS